MKYPSSEINGGRRRNQAPPWTPLIVTSDSLSLKAQRSISYSLSSLKNSLCMCIHPWMIGRVSYERDTKIINAASFTVEREDHTIGNILRMYWFKIYFIYNFFSFLKMFHPIFINTRICRQLHRDENVLFAGYKLPHPLQYKIIIRVCTSPPLFVSPSGKWTIFRWMKRGELRKRSVFVANRFFWLSLLEIHCEFFCRFCRSLNHSGCLIHHRSRVYQNPNQLSCNQEFF